MEARSSCFEKQGYEIAIHSGKTVFLPVQKLNCCLTAPIKQSTPIPKERVTLVAKAPELDNATKDSSVIISKPIDVMFGQAYTNVGNHVNKKLGTTPQLLVTATTPNNQTNNFRIR